MSEQSEREAYNESAREYHKGKEREEMDRPLFTQREMDSAVSAAVMQERQEIIAALQVLRDADEKNEGTAVYGIGLAQAVVNARPSPAVDVLGDALRKHDRLWCEALIASGDLRVIEAVTKYVIERRPESARSLVDGAPKAEKKENE